MVIGKPRLTVVFITVTIAKICPTTARTMPTIPKINQFFSSIDCNLSIYKFLGDGWVLIIDLDTDKKKLLEDFVELCNVFSDHFNKTIEKRLSTEIKPVGLTFGLDIGEIFRILIGGTREYIGPTLNIAARLQSCISNPNKLEDDPSNQLMMVRRNYYKYFKDDVSGIYKLVKARRKLKNIKNDDTFVCTRIWLI